MRRLWRLRMMIEVHVYVEVIRLRTMAFCRCASLYIHIWSLCTYLNMTSMLATQPNHFIAYIPMHRVRTKYGILNWVKARCHVRSETTLLTSAKYVRQCIHPYMTSTLQCVYIHISRYTVNPEIIPSSEPRSLEGSHSVHARTNKRWDPSIKCLTCVNTYRSS